MPSRYSRLLHCGDPVPNSDVVGFRSAIVFFSASFTGASLAGPIAQKNGRPLQRSHVWPGSILLPVLAAPLDVAARTRIPPASVARSSTKSKVCLQSEPTALPIRPTAKLQWRDEADAGSWIQERTAARTRSARCGEPDEGRGRKSQPQMFLARSAVRTWHGGHQIDCSSTNTRPPDPPLRTSQLRSSKHNPNPNPPPPPRL